ncbi:hypothetical protein [Hymenobacter convexus]|uniref:hypothetical protein n=1 Tax=Hymenobacter sp. CA1UV-4 TaxID=3063782 RepID=UPI00271446A7|nr:hypothetical protein [Hymenobacter sp. CA1UV-4]MDO7853141.1 hypothetical protein [Hymenobacter sp. CA1UV-4]
MALVNPKELIIPFAAAHQAIDVQYTEPTMGLRQHLNFGTIAFNNAGFLPDDYAVIWAISAHQITPEILKQYIDMRSLIANQSANAEQINSHFLRLNKYALGKTDAELNVPGARDFMALKNNIVSYVKRDAKTKHTLSKELRTDLEHFVTYRNIFTHGKLGLLCIAPEGFVDCGGKSPSDLDGKHRITTRRGRPSTYEWYISFLNGANETVSIKITRQLLEAYLKVYEDTLSFIRAFQEIMPFTDSLSQALQKGLDKLNGIIRE